MKALRVLILLVVGVLVAPAWAGVPLRVRVSQVGPGLPAEIIVQAIVEPGSDNRALEVSAESDALYRCSTVQLDGLRGPRVSSICFAKMPAGVYDVNVRVLAADGRELASTSELLEVR